ncbi:AraC family transcriptional regulator [Paenibacillus allorhizosphaerae]|uniref:HTH-type transcriptional activator RhaR n=1 Tax=Paenibacillus allorhizosphaerae TaxID=2849866 RepID=A0ABN7TKX7_9BACL|nr:AraC family transcriptional regulator [Paenibacillus allorhizosphaerae]CAG7644565.1 HTH-type transcriptional activator RhaR [Paenibacillus allorhizosphaerae]
MEAPNPLEHVRFLKSRSRGKRTCEPGWFWDHQTPFQDYDIFYVVSGKGTMQLGDELFHLTRKSCVVMRPGDLPKATQDDNDRLVVLYMHFDIEDNRPPECRPAAFPFPRFTQMNDNVQAESMLSQMLEALEFPSLWQDFEFDCLMKRFFVTLYRQHWSDKDHRGLSAKQIQNIRKVVAYIHEQKGRDVQIEPLAETVQMSPQYVSRLFKRYAGCSLKAYIARIKLDYALDLLAQSSLTVTEAALELGYADVYAFSKRFKALHGMSPSHYIAQLRPAKPTLGDRKRTQ